MKFGIVGNNDGPLRLLQSLEDSDFKPAFVGLQKNTDQKFRDEILEHISPNNLFFSFGDEKLAEIISSYKIDLLVNCFCNFRFKRLLEGPYEICNIHLSLLPQYRGRHPLQWTLINGEEESGFSIHEMAPEIDAGPILWQDKITVREGMSVQQLRSTIMHSLQKQFADFLQHYADGTLEIKKNDDSFATYVARRFPEDSKITAWSDSSLIFRKIKALRSENYPAYFSVSDRKIACLDARKGQKKYIGIRHPLIAEKKDGLLLLVCKDGHTLWISPEPEELSWLSPNQKVDLY